MSSGGTLAQSLYETIFSLASRFLGALPSSLFFLMTFILAVYFAAGELPRIRDILRMHLPQRANRWLGTRGKSVRSALGGWVSGATPAYGRDISDADHGLFAAAGGFSATVGSDGEFAGCASGVWDGNGADPLGAGGHDDWGYGPGSGANGTLWRGGVAAEYIGTQGAGGHAGTQPAFDAGGHLCRLAAGRALGHDRTAPWEPWCCPSFWPRPGRYSMRRSLALQPLGRGNCAWRPPIRDKTEKVFEGFFTRGCRVW